MLSWVLVSVLIGLVWGGRPDEATAAYTAHVVKQWVVEWGDTVTQSVVCRRTDVDGDGGMLLYFIDGYATWRRMPGITGLRIFNREILPTGYQATFRNRAVYAEDPDAHFPVIVEIRLRCRYADPDEPEPTLEEEDDA